MNYKGIEYLRAKLSHKRTKVLECYKYYDMKDKMDPYQTNTLPEKLRSISKKVGWIPKAVDTLSNRLQFNGFSEDDIMNLDKIFRMNNRDVLFDQMFKGAIISSCDFVYISKNDDGSARLQVIDGSNATGILDTSTMMLTEGYAVLERDTELGEPLVEAYFTSDTTHFYIKGQHDPSMDMINIAPYPLLVPVIYNPDATRPFGRSLISKSLIKYVDDAKEALRLMSVSSMFYSFPQKYVVGLDDEVEQFDKWGATMSSMLAFTKDSDGGAPTVGQFNQQSMSPYNDVLKTLASMFAGETGLTLDDLGFTTENPSSAEGIKASHESLRLMAKSAQDTFSVGIINTGYLAKCVEDNKSYKRTEFANIAVRWKPAFDVDATMLSGIGDGVSKINTAISNYFDKSTLEDLTGIRSSNDSTPAYQKPLDIDVDDGEEDEQ